MGTLSTNTARLRSTGWKGHSFARLRAHGAQLHAARVHTWHAIGCVLEVPACAVESSLLLTLGHLAWKCVAPLIQQWLREACDPRGLLERIKDFATTTEEAARPMH